MQLVDFCFLEVLERNPRTKQVRVRNHTTDAEAPDDEIIMMDRRSYDALELGAIVSGWFAPVGELWRPLGTLTLIEPHKAKLLTAGFDALLQVQKDTIDNFSQRGAMHLFWLGYRVANIDPQAEEPAGDN